MLISALIEKLHDFTSGECWFCENWVVNLCYLWFVIGSCVFFEYFEINDNFLKLTEAVKPLSGKCAKGEI